jgi:hypothetical protein
MRVRSWGLVRKSMQAGRARIGEHAEGERIPTDVKSTSPPVVASTTAMVTSETAKISCKE